VKLVRIANSSLRLKVDGGWRLEHVSWTCGFEVASGSV
jgi:hypothetical protein